MPVLGYSYSVNIKRFNLTIQAAISKRLLNCLVRFPVLFNQDKLIHECSYPWAKIKRILK
jgi:hypothetical protein